MVRATAAKNVELLREILAERAGAPVAPPSAAASRLFPEYPSRREQLRDELDYALLIAVCNDYCEMVELLLEAGARLEQFNAWYPLVMTAVDNQHLQLVKILLKFGSDPNAARHDGSAFHAIARKDSPVQGVAPVDRKKTFEIARILLDAGADVNLKNESRGVTPLHEAVSFNNTEAIKFFLNAGADVHAEDATKRTPLHCAALSGNVEHVKMLLDKGASPLAVDENSNAPWMLAMHKKYDRVARQLCSFHDVNATNAQGRTPLHIACAAGCSQSVEVLLEEGANFNAVDVSGNTPLMNAAAGKVAVVEMLLSIPHINVSHQNQDGLAAIHFAIDRLASSGNFAGDKVARLSTRIANLLISKGADLNVVPSDGCPLVVKHGDHDGVRQFLVDAGANMNAVSKEGDSVLRKVVAKEMSESTTQTHKLLSSNIDIERLSRVRYNDYTPLQSAVMHKDVSMVELLINSGAEVSHLIAWLENTDEGKAVRTDIPSEIKTLIDRNSNSLNLLDIARSAVLRNLGHRDTSSKIQELPIPKCLKKFLTHEHYYSWRSES